MTKTLMLQASAENVTPVVGSNTVSIGDFDTPVGLVVEFERDVDSLKLVRQNYAGDGWEPATHGTGTIIMSQACKEVRLQFPGIYGLAGRVEGSVKAYTVTA